MSGLGNCAPRGLVDVHVVYFWSRKWKGGPTTTVGGIVALIVAICTTAVITICICRMFRQVLVRGFTRSLFGLPTGGWSRIFLPSLVPHHLFPWLLVRQHHCCRCHPETRPWKSANQVLRGACVRRVPLALECDNEQNSTVGM